MRLLRPYYLSFLRIPPIARCCGLFLLLTGCSDDGPPLGKMVPVKGKVIFNGKPLSAGTVTFIPIGEGAKGPPPEGEIQAGGVYSLTTRGREGAPVGTYRAILSAGPEDKVTAATIDPRYCHPKQSPLVMEVAENKPAGGYDLHVKARGQR